MPYYDVEVSRLDAPNPVLLTAKIEARSKFLMTSPKGGSWNPLALLRDSYDGFCDVPEVLFEFFTLVSVDYVNYLSRSNTVAMKKFMLQGSVDGENWTTLLYRENEICYGKVYTEIKGCFRYFKLTIGYTGDDNKPGGIMLFGTEVDNNDFEVVNLTPYMSSNTTAFATLTASNISSGSAADLTDTDTSTYMRVTSSTSEDTTQQGRWIKYELTTPGIANLLELMFHNTNTQANWFKLEGSNDDATWDLLLERQYQTNQLFNNGYRILYVHLQNETGYKFYKLTCVATNDPSDNWDIAGFKLFSKRKIEGRFNFYRGVPKLTEASQDGYEISASSEFDSGHAAKYAFDGDAATKWAVAGKGAGAWLRIKLPEAVVFKAFQVASRGDANYNTQASRNFEIQGSNDGENWNTLSTQTDISWQQGEYKTFHSENETAYLYYRLYISANNGGSDTGIGEFVLGNFTYEYKRRLEKYDALIPKLASDTDQSYNVSVSSVYPGTSHYAYKVFDNGTGENNKWLSKTNDTTNAWVKVELPTAMLANAFLIQMPNEMYTERSPKNFEIQASNNGSTWTTLLTASELSWSRNQARTFVCENTTAYKFYRIYITSSNGANIVHIGEWQLYHSYLVVEY